MKERRETDAIPGEQVSSCRSEIPPSWESEGSQTVVETKKLKIRALSRALTVPRGPRLSALF